MLARLFVFFVLLVPVLPGCASADDQDRNLSRYSSSSLQIATTSGRVHRFKVYLALSPEQMRAGLMHVRSLPDNEGMLFVHPRPRELSMWMKNTLLPLDMLFVRANGEIASIVENTTPHSLDSIRSNEPVLAVLELNAGTVERLGIHPGDKLLHEAFAR